MKPKAYDYFEAQSPKTPLKPRDIILYPNGGFPNYPDFEIVEQWMDKNFEYVAVLNKPEHQIWKFRITGILKPRSW